MSMTWQSDDEPEETPITPLGWVRVVLRGTVMGTVCGICLVLTLLFQAVEKPLFGARRPVSPYLTRMAATLVFPILGIRFRVRGRPESGRIAVVANHASWLDIFSLNAKQRIYFVSKAEVADWPGIGWLARATGTAFINRDPRDARVQAALFKERLSHDHRLLFFPEGTSSDGLRILPFKSTLFAAVFHPDLKEGLRIQPVTLRYCAPKGCDPRFYGWWGDMEFGPHLIKVLAAPRQGSVEVVYHPSVAVSDFKNRKVLARTAEETVRSAL